MVCVCDCLSAESPKMGKRGVCLFACNGYHQLSALFESLLLVWSDCLGAREFDIVRLKRDHVQLLVSLLAHKDGYLGSCFQIESSNWSRDWDSNLWNPKAWPTNTTSVSPDEECSRRSSLTFNQTSSLSIPCIDIGTRKITNQPTMTIQVPPVWVDSSLLEKQCFVQTHYSRIRWVHSVPISGHAFVQIHFRGSDGFDRFHFEVEIEINSAMHGSSCTVYWCEIEKSWTMNNPPSIDCILGSCFRPSWIWTHDPINTSGGAFDRDWWVSWAKLKFKHKILVSGALRQREKEFGRERLDIWRSQLPRWLWILCHLACSFLGSCFRSSWNSNIKHWLGYCSREFGMSGYLGLNLGSLDAKSRQLTYYYVGCWSSRLFLSWVMDSFWLNLAPTLSISLGGCAWCEIGSKNGTMTSQSYTLMVHCPRSFIRKLKFNSRNSCKMAHVLLDWINLGIVGTSRP